MSPIEGYDEIQQLQRLGFVRRGYQEQQLDAQGKPILNKAGKPKIVPVATPYFIVPPEVQKVLGEEKPTRLPIYFLLEVDRALEHYLMRFSGNGKVRCVGDGASVRYRRYINTTEKKFYTVIHRGVAKWKEISAGMLTAWKADTGMEGYGTAERYGGEAGNTVRCLHHDCPQFKQGWCKPTGFLKFGIQGIPAQGYYQMTVHHYALKPALDQLRWARDIVESYLGERTIIGPRFTIAMKGPEKMFVRGQATTVWLPQVALEEKWLDMAMHGRIRLPGRPQIRVMDIYGTNGAAANAVLAPSLAEEEVDLPPEVLEDRGYDTEEESAEGGETKDWEAELSAQYEALEEYVAEQGISDEELTEVMERVSDNPRKALEELRKGHAAN